MRPPTITPVPVVATPAHHGGRSSPGAALRTIISKALAQRRAIIHACGGHRGGPELWLSIGRLQQWLDRNPCPSASTVRAFQLYTELALVMPGTKGGRTLLAQARALSD